MSRHKIVDIIGVIIILTFLIAIFLLPPLKEFFLKYLCIPEASLMKDVQCTYGYLLLFVIPFVSTAWLMIRVFTKMTKFAALVQPDSQLCRGIGTVYRKMKFMDD